MKPGGRIAGYVIHTPAGLGAADERRARELGPDHVTAAALPEDLTREAGFSDVVREDVTGQFRATVEAMLRAEQGDAEYADGCERGEAKLIGIREGLLLRSLVTAIKR